jgi:SAM-dependent methyltransferase
MRVTKAIKAAVNRLAGKKPSGRFTNSAEYWESRYRSGGNSGAGSYNRLARFKADFLNRFVEERGVQSVVEFGSGDGAQLTLARYPQYTGVDVSETVIRVARERFAGNPSVRFLHISEVTPDLKADLALSLDVIYHLVEDQVFELHMRQLFGSALRYAIVYSSNDTSQWRTPHVRHREFTSWVSANRSDFRLIEHVPNAFPFDPDDLENTSFADFFVFERVA